MIACVGCLGGCGGSFSNDISQNAFAPTAGATAPARSSAAETAAKITAGATRGSSVYQIGPLDVLDVSVFNVPDLTKTVQVSDTGIINYPLVGEVQAAGKTAHQLESDLKRELGAKYLRHPEVSILVREYNSQRVTVEGGVKNAGVYAIKGTTTLTQVLAMAGDVDGSVASGDIIIFRTIDNKRCAARFDFDAIRSGKTEDPEIQPGDVVVADMSNAKVVLANVLKALPLATSAAVFVPLM